MSEKETNQSLDDWFMREILPHEQSLMSYIRRIWRGSSSDVADVRQECYARVYKACRKQRPDYPKALLFATARNYMIDQIRREQVVSIDLAADVDVLDHSRSHRSVEEHVASREELYQFQNILNTLSADCRDVIVLRKVFGYSQKETAEKLSLSVSAVQNYTQRGIRKIAEELSGLSEYARSKTKVYHRQSKRRENDQ